MKVGSQVRFSRAGSLVAVCMASSILPLNFTGGILAIPAIAHEMGGPPQALNWVSNAFILAFGSLLMTMGSLADNHGRRRLFIVGVVVFTCASLLIGFSPNILILDLWRAVQGAAGAAMLAGGGAALADAFEGSARLRAFGMQGTSFGIGLSCGPVLAGYLVEQGGWRSVFLLSVLIGGLATLAGKRWMRESSAARPNPLDLPGILLFSMALALMTWGILQVASSGWGAPLVQLLLGGSLCCWVAFVVMARRSPFPMLDLSLFRYPAFIGVQLLPVATCYCFVVLLALLPARFMGAEGLDSMTTGLFMVALSGPMLVVPGLAVYLTRWAAPARLCCLGLVLAAAGLYALSVSERHVMTLLSMLAIGIGAGLPWGLMDALSVSVVPRDRAGMATGIFSTVRVAGEGITLATVSTCLVALMSGQLTNSNDAALADIRYLVSGNASLLQYMPLAYWRTIYLHAFNQLMVLLSAVTLLSALLIHVCLNRRSSSIHSPVVSAAEDEASC
ncbi:MFS transporter [Musicola keenii]|uniref:MFS transporter n=1 Tax=Musicola keenii TaxID=2884250 RepID=UPI00177ADC5B|nr:MFS transporter [Musicola keenii]